MDMVLISVLALVSMVIGWYLRSLCEGRSVKTDIQQLVDSWDKKVEERIEIDPVYLPANFFVGHSLESDEEFEKRFLMEGIEVYTHLTHKEG